MKLSKFQFAALVLIGVLVCGIVALSIDVLRMKAELDRLYWIRETTHSGGVRIAIEVAEAKLHEQLTILAVLGVVAALVIVGSILMKHKSISGTVKNMRGIHGE